MFLVGLTGGIASGKSTVAARFAAHGFPVVDADAVARQVLAAGEPALQAVAEHFGPGVLRPDGGLDRPALARIVFAEPAQRAALEAITHPVVARRIQDLLDALTGSGPVVLDVPLLVEAGIDRDYRAVVVVATRPETQVHRLMTHRGLTRDEARARVAAQAPLQEKLAVATDVLWNEESLETLGERTDALAADLAARARTGPAHGRS